ncbi:MAG TPA: helix-turn-helix transcriptional regulator [Thermoanaerobaculia bacterium]|nr:helix-turn-helix transcriptional regulator [Thermoanaerobaculia bacterium]
MAKTTKEGEIFGAHMRELRLARGLTQPQLAERCESNVPFISNVERGVMLPGLAMLLRLADALECNVSELVRVLDRAPAGVKSRRN